MMPIVWFYVALVVVLWSLLAYVEIQRRDRQRVRGCLELEAVPAEKLWSMMIMDPDLAVIELQPDPVSASAPVLIHGAVRVSISNLETYLRSAGPGRSFAFYSLSPDATLWDDVDGAVCGAGLKKGYVLEGGVELWRKSRLPLQAASGPRRAAG